MPNIGPHPPFETVQTADDAQALFEHDFPDTLPLIPELREDFVGNPTGTLGTLYLQRWHLDGRALLLGDAATAMVPFPGQGADGASEVCGSLRRIATAVSIIESIGGPCCGLANIHVRRCNKKRGRSRWLAAEPALLGHVPSSICHNACQIHDARSYVVSITKEMHICCAFAAINIAALPPKFVDSAIVHVGGRSMNWRTTRPSWTVSPSASGCDPRMR